VALLLDQVERLRSRGLNVCYLMSEMDETEKENILHKLNLNPPEYNFLFVTPETVLTPTVFELLRKISFNNLLNFFVIDEAHCIDMWGFHFRPSCYELRKPADFGGPMLAMTGTATNRTEDATILKSLRLPVDTVVIRKCSMSLPSPFLPSRHPIR